MGIIRRIMPMGIIRGMMPVGAIRGELLITVPRWNSKIFQFVIGIAVLILMIIMFYAFVL